MFTLKDRDGKEGQNYDIMIKENWRITHYSDYH